MRCRDPKLEALTKKYNSAADIIECAHRPQYLKALNGEVRIPLADLKGRKVAAFSGIATPESFELFLREGGAQLVFVRRFIDHHWYTPDDLCEIYTSAQKMGAGFIVTTEKDAVRIAPSSACELPLYYLRLEIEILRGADNFGDAVEKICFPTGQTTKS